MRRLFEDWAVRELAPALHPERADRHLHWVDRTLSAWAGRLVLWSSPLSRARLRRFANAVLARGAELEAQDDASLETLIEALRASLPRTGLARPQVIEAFALVREVSGRRLGVRHYPVQLMGGYALLRGRIAEMATGEGKTLTGLLPAVTVALARVPVHVVTVNEYLARRDAEELAPVLAAFGLSVGWIEPEQDPDERRRMYARDVTYCVNKDLVFDYLKDGLMTGQRTARGRTLRRFLDGRVAADPHLLRGLCFAIVDEADSIFVDEARTPLIISSEKREAGARDDFAFALELARSLPASAYRIVPAERAARLTPEGRALVEAACAGGSDLPIATAGGVPHRDREIAPTPHRDREIAPTGRGGVWRFRRAREQMIEQALAALHLYERDTHYIIVEGKAQIVDESTGRTMPDRTWEHGLHQLIETKEGLETTKPRETIARITYQRFFCRYLRLAGMTGTGAEIAPEIRAVYGIDTLRIPTHRPIARKDLGERVFVRAADRWDAVVERVRDAVGQGRAVLVGTRSVEASEVLAALLARAGLEHTLLNARLDAEEAEIVAAAGQPGRVTVATNMAGRGTDIKLDPAVREAGGLHVILTEYHESRRIDRQLFGRAGRQGDPGSCESLVSLEDELFVTHAGWLVSSLLWLSGADRELPGWLGGLLRRTAQAAAERRNARVRKRTLEGEKHKDRSLAFAGVGE
jgi:preprotein translocase subunit SecA